MPVLIGGGAVALVSSRIPACFPDPAARTGTRVTQIRKWSALEQQISPPDLPGLSDKQQSRPAPGGGGGRGSHAIDRRRRRTGVAVLPVTAPNLLKELPTAALAAVVIASAIGLIEVTDLVRFYRIQR
jgi:hypothetical protein